MQKKSKRNELIHKAEIWAENLWNDATGRWAHRTGQDRKYRAYVINPVIRNILTTLYPDGGAHIIELGCGDGALLEETAVLSAISPGGWYRGLDRSEILVAQAREQYTRSNIDFIIGDVTDLPDTINISVESDCLISIMSIQEIPDITAFLSTMKLLAHPGSRVIIITVKPEFGDRLLRDGSIFMEPSLSPAEKEQYPLWRWAGRYPIVDEPFDTFYLPYFHRDISDYRTAFSNYGFIINEEIAIPEINHALPELVKQGVSPFVSFEQNDYWPAIAEESSSMAFVLTRELK